MLLRLLLFFNMLVFGNPFRIASWYVSENKYIIPTKFPPQKINWDIYTHIRSGDPFIFPNGTAICDKQDKVTPIIIREAHKHQAMVLWGAGIGHMHELLTDPQKKYIRENYLNSIQNAVEECNIDGIEIDYEWQDTNWGKLGIVTPQQSLQFTQFLADIKTALGANKIVAADVSIWGIGHGNYILGFLPWINVKMLNEGAFDYINTMSYHWNQAGNILAWEKDALFIDLWGIDRKRVNLGIPYYSRRGKEEPAWNTLSTFCPNIDPNLNICNGTIFIGKKMNQKIGEYVRNEGFGGVFPWAANYDSTNVNNSLIIWLNDGLEEDLIVSSP